MFSTYEKWDIDHLGFEAAKKKFRFGRRKKNDY